MRILIIEDETLIRECFFRIALSRGHRVKSEKDGINGLKTWLSFQPHLVLLDVLIPKMDGPTVLQKAGKINNEKVMMMSAHRAFAHGINIPNVDLFVSKPFVNIVEVFNQAERLCFYKEKELSI